jgi:hypothetical protein
MAKKLQMTHVGYEIGVDARCTPNYRRLVLLRETKNHWIDDKGQKYRKPHGMVDVKWPMYRIDPSTIQVLPQMSQPVASH